MIDLIKFYFRMIQMIIIKSVDFRLWLLAEIRWANTPMIKFCHCSYNRVVKLLCLAIWTQYFRIIWYRIDSSKYFCLVFQLYLGWLLIVLVSFLRPSKHLLAIRETRNNFLLILILFWRTYWIRWIYLFLTPRRTIFWTVLWILKTQVFVISPWWTCWVCHH